jgi:predicted ester cyclase
MGLPATGKEVRVPSMIFFSIADGKVQEEWQVADRLVLLQQIGLAPGPEPVAG